MSNRFQVIGQTADYQQRSYVFTASAPVTTAAGREQVTADLDYIVSLITDAGGTAYMAAISLDTDVPLPSGATAVDQRIGTLSNPAGDYTSLFDLAGPLEEA
ncbi:hypothetical protein KIY81_gp08 [Mycobacterium phage Bugsy]|uniref:Uncharacterized protein n=1 Tax=Mycobacterium phage Bugsy TaxID=2656567 RepID=A0A649VDX5_9CAUD|nr:hypothetical protein KIY81_gp08 [Mycobacterium phage Bugsy]QGJ90531.1 hypothetical protein SEA_BUGSY_8 [Mycobacterium phage Bugsy]